MGGDPLDDIMSYLGLAPVVADDLAADASIPDPPAIHVDKSGEHLLGTGGGSSLWMTGNDDAEWIEMRGPFPTLRATRPKAKLLVSLRIDIERWADGGRPETRTRDLTITTAMRQAVRVLEIRYRKWKPIRLSQVQAKALLKLVDHVGVFATGF